MDLYGFLLSAFHQFIAFFPQSLQWLVAVLILLGLIGLLMTLIRQHVLFIVLAIVLLPFLIPLLGEILTDLLSFIGYLLSFIQHTFFGRTR